MFYLLAGLAFDLGHALDDAQHQADEPGTDGDDIAGRRCRAALGSRRLDARGGRVADLPTLPRGEIVVPPLVAAAAGVGAFVGGAEQGASCHSRIVPTS